MQSVLTVAAIVKSLLVAIVRPAAPVIHSIEIYMTIFQKKSVLFKHIMLLFF